MRRTGVVWLMAAWLSCGAASAEDSLPTYEGLAEDGKAGALLVPARGAPLHVANLGAWPTLLRGRRLRVLGSVSREGGEAAPETADGGQVQRLPEGRLVLRQGRWTLLAEPAPRGLPLLRGTPLALPGGATLTLDVVTHKHAVGGAVVGVWEVSARKGEAVRTARVVGDALYAELDAFGSAVVVAGEGEAVHARVLDTAGPDLDATAALAAATALATALGWTPQGSARGLRAGVHELTLSGEGDDVVSLRLGAQTGRLLPGSTGLLPPAPTAPKAAPPPRE